MMTGEIRSKIDAVWNAFWAGGIANPHMAAVDKFKSAHRAFLAKLDALFASLQHRAFRGEL